MQDCTELKHDGGWRAAVAQTILKRLVNSWMFYL